MVIYAHLTRGIRVFNIFDMHKENLNQKEKQTQKALLSIANFIDEASSTSTFKTIHEDFQELFSVLMLTDDADDFEFREKAFLMLQFTKFFSSNLSNHDWQIVSKAAKELKDVVSLKIIGNE